MKKILFMKVFFVACMLFASVSSFATENENSVEVEKEKTSIENVKMEHNPITSTVKEVNDEFECSITSSGTIETSTGSFEATLTVTGPCDASLADKMREAIRVLRASFN